MTEPVSMARHMEKGLRRIMQIVRIQMEWTANLQTLKRYGPKYEGYYEKV